MLIATVEGSTRLLLVHARVAAMEKGSDSASTILVSADSDSLPDKIAKKMLWCELLALDNRLTEATSVFDAQIEPLLEHLSLTESTVLLDNRLSLAMAAHETKEMDNFYHYYDVRQILGVELHNSSSQLAAEHAANLGKHYKALPGLWQQLQEAYKKLNWNAMRWAHEAMARECASLGWPDEAAWHSVQSLDDKLVIEIGQRLELSGDSRRIENAVERLLKYSSLARHSSQTAKLLGSIYDSIPDKHLSRVIEWVQPRLSFLPRNWQDSWIFDPAWQLVANLAHRLTPELALQLAQKASKHECLREPSVARRHVIKAWNNLIGCIEPVEIVQFVKPALELVAALRSDFDYPDSINLLFHMSGRNSSCKETIKNALFPSGGKIANPLLFQLAAEVGVKPQNIEKLNADACGIANALRKQVQIIAANEEPESIGGVSQVTKSDGKEKLVVHIGGGEPWLHAFLSHKDCLNDNTIRTLTLSIFEMVENSRNAVANRISLIEILQNIVSRLPTDLVEKGCDVLSRISRGDFTESDVGQSHSEATSLLNPFKMGLGNPKSLRGIALITLAKGSKMHVTWSKELHSSILQDFLETTDDELRSLGVVAAYEADRLTDSETIALIANALDGTSKVKRLVLRVLSNPNGVVFDSQGVRLAARAIIRSSGSSDAEERAASARAANRLLTIDTLPIDIKNKLTQVMEASLSDISYFVRNTAKEASIGMP